MSRALSFCPLWGRNLVGKDHCLLVWILDILRTKWSLGLGSRIELLLEGLVRDYVVRRMGSLDIKK